MIGEKLADRYEVTGELGHGGMGVVYRAQDPLLKREVAIKVIAPSMLTPQTEQRFQAEAQVVAQMDHPNIVQIYDFGRHQGSLFFVMPVVQGTSLRALMREHALTLGEILDVGIAVADALAYSQERGIVHRDIKPENIMVTREGGGMRVRVMDFGLARASDVTRITKTGMMVGTMSYVSPEQVTGKAVDTRSDIYSLGTVLYECVCGEVPFAGEMQSVLYRVVHEFPQPPRERGADIHEELERIILSCLAKDPGERPEKAASLVQSLRRYHGHLQDEQRQRSVMVTRTMTAARPAMAPFVDRVEEFKELQSRLNAAVAGECQFVAVAGEMGVGKTRLLDELEGLATARGLRVLHGRFVEQDGAFPYHGFCEALQEYFRQKETGSSGGETPDFSDLAGELVALFPVLSEIDALRSTSSGAGPAATAESRTPENRTEIYELLARILIRIAEGRPLVLLLEEMHGAEASIEALQYIVRRLGPTPTLIVGTYRPDEVERGQALTRMLEGFRGDRRFAALTLEPFGPDDHAKFLATLIGGTSFAKDLAGRLFESTEGNPFFTKELVRSLLDSGGIAQDDTGSWALSGGMDIASGALPATIQEAVEKRIGRLPEDMRRVLSVAAVMGKSFDFRDLEKLAGDEEDLDDLIDRLVQEGLVEEERQSRGDTLTFTSGVVREVLYAELSRRKRRALHRKYGSLLEKRHAGKLERILSQLVYHFAEGDEPGKTVEYGLQHARRSLEAFSPEEAVRSVKTALEFLDEEWEGERRLEGEARSLLAAAFQMAGDVDGALREIAAAVKVYEREKNADAAVAALLDAALISWKSRRPTEARRWVDRGLEAARAAGNSERLGALLSLAATLANLRGEYDKAAEFQQEAERVGGTAATAAAEAAAVEGGELSVAFANPVAAREPAVMATVEEWEVFTNVYETLLTTDADGNPSPVLAERWEADPEGRTFTFHLAGGVLFADGTPLSAADVKAAFERSIRAAADGSVPALLPIQGRAAFLEGAADQVSGLVARDESILEVRLDESLPIYPALLTDARTGVFKMSGEAADTLLGTGRFQVESRDPGRITLSRNPHWRSRRPHVDRLVFRHGMKPAEIVQALEGGDVDVVGDLPPADLERLLREPRFRHGLAETPKSSTYFLLFNTVDGALADASVRTALARVIRPQDLVWRTVGRLAQPANGLLPPGMLGHDPGRRRPAISPDEARAAIGGRELTLRVAVHPVIRDRHGALLEALFGTWAELGVKVEVQATDMAAYQKTWTDPSGIDLNIMRWAADYNDPDNFTHNMFHSRSGLLKSYFHSHRSDELITAARTESRPRVRERHYRQFEDLLMESGSLVPLFHEVDTRLAGPRVRGLALSGGYPAVNYGDLWKSREAAAPAAPVRAGGGGIIRIPVAAQVRTIDPAEGQRIEDHESVAGVYETLTRFSGARIEPWLAASFSTEEGGRVYRFRLREDIRFHDGRRLTARDVRFTFERQLTNPRCERRGQYAPIKGARSLLETGKGELSGFHIHSAHEFTIELDRPVVFFPFLISDISAGIVPEGTGRIGSTPREGAVGTGPFRVVGFDPGRRLELTRNPDYWRPGSPRCDQIIFELGARPEEIMSGFKEGRFSLAADLHPADVESLRRDPVFGSGYREAPSLSTYYISFNVNMAPTNRREVRQRLAGVVDMGKLVRQTLGSRAVPAAGWIPPGLLEHETASKPARSADASSSTALELTAAVHPVFRGEHAPFFDALERLLKEAGIRLKSVAANMEDFVLASESASVNLEIGRWYADYPDADAFAHALQSKEKIIGQLCGTAELDELIAAGRSETDPRARQATYRQLEALVARERVLLPLFHEQVYRFVHPTVEGLTVSDWQPIVSYGTLRAKS